MLSQQKIERQFYPHAAVIRFSNMLRDARTAGLVTPRCGIDDGVQGPQWAVLGVVPDRMVALEGLTREVA